MARRALLLVFTLLVSCLAFLAARPEAFSADCPGPKPTVSDTITWTPNPWGVPRDPIQFNRIVGDSSCESSARMGMYLKENVYQSGNDLVILVRRHCAAPVDDGNRTNDSENVVVGGCANSNDTQYSIGRLEMVNAQFAAAPPYWRWGFTAKIPQSRADGTRVSLWLRNVGVNGSHTKCDFGNVDERYAEIDITEWYSWGMTHTDSAGNKNKGESTTWGCDPNPANRQPPGCDAADANCLGDKVLIGTKKVPSTLDMTQFHDYQVTRYVDPSSGKVEIKYYVDDDLVWYASHNCPGSLAVLTAALCRTAFNESWISILQTAVLNGANPGKFYPPDPDLAFPQQKLIIRDMWMSTQAALPR